MKIKKGTPAVFIRLTNYKDYSFIEEHKKVLEKNNYVWILKVGQFLKEKALTAVMENNSGIIMKTPAKEGHKFYFCHLCDIDPKNIDIYPDYYKDFLYEYGYTLESTKEPGHWFKIDSMIPMKEEDVKSFEVSSTKRNLLEVGCKFRVVQLYVEAIKDVDLK